MNIEPDNNHLHLLIDTISNHNELAIFIQKLHQNLIDDPSDWDNINYEPYRVCRRPTFLRECPDEKSKIHP
jgi:hypothetical protein